MTQNEDPSQPAGRRRQGKRSFIGRFPGLLRWLSGLRVRQIPGSLARSAPKAAPLDQNESRKRKRERSAIILLTILFIGLTLTEVHLSKGSSSLPFVNSIFFFGLLNINLILLIALVWLIFRNIGKVFVERRSRILGARLKTKLVLAFLAFSLIPTLILFAISSLYINSSFDKWFSIKVQNTLQASLEITHTYYRNADNTAAHFAQHLAKQLRTRLNPRFARNEPGTLRPPPKWMGGFLNRQRELLGLNALEFYSDPFEPRVLSHAKGGPRARSPGSKGDDVVLPNYYPRLSLDLLEKTFSGEQVSVVQHIGTGDLIRTLVPVYVRGSKGLAGVLAVNTYIPVSLVNKVDSVASVFDDYKETNPLKYPIKTTYFVILVMVTLVMIFVAIWMGLFLARELTVPVERLVHGAREVGRGNLEVKIASTGHDEIAVLVDSFNSMIKDLKENRKNLTRANADLEKHSLQLEAVLANVGTGVIVVDRHGEITTFNRAASQLLEIDAGEILSRHYGEVLKGEAQPLADLVKTALKSSAHSRDPHPTAPEVTQWNFRTGDTVKALAGIATSLEEKDDLMGVVVVIDEMTHLIKAQREVAWREVARRIAHEIKNPLTPIKLSAQRLQRRLQHFVGKDQEILDECTSTIVRHTDELKEMVNEFSNFARFPEASPAPHNLNEVIEEVVTLFQQAHGSIDIVEKRSADIPTFEFDRDQIKRVMMNLIDNATAALGNDGATKARVEIETRFDAKVQLATIEIRDNGPGMSDDVLSRVFEPYFSTKKEGTGLGLAIAKRIINDHDGVIRVTSRPGEGTVFLIELPTTVKHGFDQRKKGVISEESPTAK